MEIQQAKINTQVTELQRLNSDNTELKTLQDQEKDKNAKLLTIAKGKYKMDVKSLDSYMPRGVAYQEKLKVLAISLIEKGQKEKK